MCSMVSKIQGTSKGRICSDPFPFLFEFFVNGKIYMTGCSIPVVRMHGVHVDRVQFPAARN